MNVPSNEELEILRNGVRAFTRDRKDHRRLRELRHGATGYSKDVAAHFSAMEWNGILFPEELGGSATGFSAMAVILEELGKGLIADPLVSSAVLAGRTLQYCGSQSLKESLLPRIADGTLTASLAWQEKAGSLDVSGVQTTASLSADCVTLNGKKRFVAGPDASGFVVSARTNDATAVVWVPRETPGLGLQIEWRADGTPVGELNLHKVSVPVENLAAGADVALARAVDEASIMVCAEMLGVMRAALDITTEYMRNRVQFGRPIGSFQALQHKAVDLFIQQELASAVVAEAAELLDKAPTLEDRTRMVARAKSRCNDACLRITRESIQLHGGIGTTDECDIGLYFKRALTLSAWLGSSPTQRRRYAPFARQECEQNV